MRWCSRNTAGDISAVTSACFAGAIAVACGPREGGDAVQAASASARAAKPAWANRSLVVPRRNKSVRREYMGPVAMGPELLTATSQFVTRRPRGALTRDRRTLFAPVASLRSTGHRALQ